MPVGEPGAGSVSGAEALILAALDRAEPEDAELAGAGLDRPTWHWLAEELARCGASLLTEASAEGRGWTEVCIGSDDIGAAMSSWLLSDGPERIGALLQDRSLEHFFFVYKSPGLRLRFRPAVGSTFASRARSASAVRKGFDGCALGPGVYEPETPLLGIDAGLAATHAFFTVDSLAVIDYQAHWVRRPARDLAAPWLYSLGISQAVIKAATGDSNEAWAVWHRLATHDRPPRDGVSHPVEPQWNEAARYSLDLECLGVPAANGAFAAIVATGRAAADSRLRSCFPCGLRITLAHWILFHWNRMGFGVDTQRSLAAAMERVLRPGQVAVAKVPQNVP